MQQAKKNFVIFTMLPFACALRSSILNSQAFFGQDLDYWRALIPAKHYKLIMGAAPGD